MDKEEFNKTISCNKVNIRKDQLSLQSAPVSEEIKKVLQETKEEKETRNQITEYLNFVEDSFQKCFLSKGYIEESAVNITSQIDKTIDFVGSKISPLKPYILTEDFGNEGRFLIQNSMKLKTFKYLQTNIPQKFGCYFKCMGILAKPDLEKRVKETFDFLTNPSFLNIPFEDLCIKINSNDQDLMEAISSLDKRIMRKIDTLSMKHYIHKYGMDEYGITGRDFNIGVRKKGTDDFFSCAGFVVVENPIKTIAVDMGFGNSALAMCKFGTNSTIASSRIADIVSVESVAHEKFADALTGVSIFLKEDIMNHSSRHFRRKFKIFVKILKYWNSILYNYTNEQLADLIIKFLELEYRTSFDKFHSQYSAILSLSK